LGAVSVALDVSDDSRIITLTPNGDTWSGTVSIVVDRTALFDVQGNQGSGTDTITITVP
jgi:hypothetical protein